MSQTRSYKGPVQFAKFSAIGMFNGAIDLAALNVLLYVWHNHSPVSLFVMNSAAYALAVLNSYYWNAKLTFRRNSSFTSREKAKFVTQALISLLISNFVFLLFEYVFGLFPLPSWIVHNASKGLAMALSSMCSFFFMKYFVFRGS